MDNIKITETIARINKRDEKNRIKRNAEIDKFNMAYKIEDSEGNVFVFGGIENNMPWYRSNGGCCHQFDLVGFKVLQKYDEVE